MSYTTYTKGFKIIPKNKKDKSFAKFLTYTLKKYQKTLVESVYTTKSIYNVFAQMYFCTGNKKCTVCKDRVVCITTWGDLYDRTNRGSEGRGSVTKGDRRANNTTIRKRPKA